MALSKRQIPYLFSTVVLLIGGILFFTFPIRNLFGMYKSGPLLAIPVFAAIYMGLLYLLVVSTFFLASFVDPGVYPRESTDEEDDSRHPLYRVITIDGVQVKMKWCESCKFYRPPRCSHCSICDNCVESFDHHCPWVDNCIGKRNYKYFFYFVTFLTTFILSGFVWCVLSIVLYADHLTSVIVEFILLTVGVLVFIPVVGLTGFHCGLVCMGRTTNEHVTGKFRGSHNPFNEGCARNCAKALCGSKQPRYMHYRANSYASPTAGQRDRPEGIPLYEELDNHHHSLQREDNGMVMDRQGRETQVPIQMAELGNHDNVRSNGTEGVISSTNPNFGSPKSATGSPRSLEIAEVTV